MEHAHRAGAAAREVQWPSGPAQPKLDFNQMWQTLPEFGTGVLYAIIVAAAYTMGVAIASARGRPRLLQAARLGTYGTVSLVLLAVLVLAYAFVSHDFRLSYVSRYSDRGMTTPYLIAALWGGQDGSLLWWLFLSSLFSAACVFWLERKYLELQPWVIATLMGNVIFFGGLMIFAANPFTLNIGGAPIEGAGLNYQLRNFYMIIHPPSLYVGFTSSTIPFAFAVAAMVTGRLDDEWIVASRKWMLFSWLFLAIGNCLGMKWAYEMLGWGGPWAWDPVENAAFLPWLTASAYLHSIMIQERRGMLKIWNVGLICTTFWLTIFGTFLTRSGLIASVHSFARSGIGVWFLWYMGFIAAVAIALLVWRLPKLQSEGSFEAVLSREAAFLGNNWGFVSLMVFIAVATIWPRISEWLLDQKSALAAPFYNMWIPPVALVVFALMGVAPLLGWRKTSPELFSKSFRWPIGVMVTVAIAHLAFGRRFGFPAFVNPDPIYPGALGKRLADAASVYPFATVALSAFNIAVVVQEFVRGVRARQTANKDEGVVASLLRLIAKSRRRYGGYLVHVGVAVMMIGFAGRAWGVDKEVSLLPGQETQIEEYRIKYLGPRMEVDQEKRMIITDVEVHRHGKFVGKIYPAKVFYKTGGDQPATNVGFHVTLKNDLYITPGLVNPQTKIAGFQIHVNQLISFIWIGGILLALSSCVSLWPDVSFEDSTAFSYLRAGASIGTAILFGFLLAGGTAVAYAAPRYRPPLAPVSSPTSAPAPPGAGDLDAPPPSP
jgi:cytochrome c-type biogenesis protein CcmF